MRKRKFLLLLLILVGLALGGVYCFGQNYEVTNIEANIAELCVEKLGSNENIVIEHTATVADDFLVLYWRNVNRTLCGLSQYRIGKHQTYQFCYMTYSFLDSPQQNQLFFAELNGGKKKYRVVYGELDDPCAAVMIKYPSCVVQKIMVQDHMAFDISEEPLDFYEEIELLDSNGNTIVPAQKSGTIRAGSISTSQFFWN